MGYLRLHVRRHTHERVAALDAYWQTFGGLKEALFAHNGTPYAALAVEGVATAIHGNAAVLAWQQKYTAAFADCPRI